MSGTYDFKRLEKNIWDVIKEQQIKLGYCSEVIRLYYPLSSLQRFLACDLDEKAIYDVLYAFSDEVEERLGKITFSNQADRFCFCMDKKATDYIHANTPKEGFLYDLIDVIQHHGVTMEEVFAVFNRYSEAVCIEKAEHGEFDYLVYFADGLAGDAPDSYRYCLHKEGEHIIYHRYTKEDYADFYFD